MVPDLRALCLKEIAMRVQDDFGGDLRMGLAGTLPEVRKILKSFHGIADPGADRILLFAGIKPIAAVPSNCPQVLPRIVHGRENESYVASYREAQRLLSTQIAETFDSRNRTYLLIETPRPRPLQTRKTEMWNLSHQFGMRLLCRSIYLNRARHGATRKPCESQLSINLSSHSRQRLSAVH